MDGFTFDARIDGRNIVCTITTPINLCRPVLCFSLLAPASVISGGTIARRVGGYTEIQLSDLTAGEPRGLVVAYAAPEYRPVNRAWLPLGAYLRVGNQTFALPAIPAGLADSVAARPAPYDGLRLVPPPSRWLPSAGKIKVDGFQCLATDVSAVDALSRRCGLPPFYSDAGIPLALVNDPALPFEGYRLQIEPSGITLAHSDPAGAFYGAISLLMLRSAHGGQIPCGTIEDAPRFEWRGQHLDCARHFFRPATLQRLLDLMALFKLNRFHWHFSDDEAFRLEVECFPEIWQKSAFRGEGELVPGVFGGGLRSGGSYSKQDARDLVSHARALQIEVLPEIEVPAHALCLTATLPGLRDPADNGMETSVQGYHGNVVNPAMPQAWALLEALSLEVSELFPIGLLHLGCDELPDHTWDGSPAIAALMEREDLATRSDVQEWTMRRLAGHVAAHGVRPAAWEEAAQGPNGGIGHDALLFSWTGLGSGTAAAKAGYDVVMCPAQNVYLDMAHTADPDDWGAAWAAFIDLADTIAWSVVPDPAIADRIKGVEGTYWSEFTTSDDEIEPLIAPRIMGVATMGWSSQDALCGDDLAKLAWHHETLFSALGWKWRRP